jgi:hypothetical protein
MLAITKSERSIYPSKSSHNADPFLIEWLPADGLACSVVPVGCVALIAFFAMQVGVDPRTLDAFVLRPAAPIRALASNRPWHPTITRRGRV